MAKFVLLAICQVVKRKWGESAARDNCITSAYACTAAPFEGSLSEQFTSSQSDIKEELGHEEVSVQSRLQSSSSQGHPQRIWGKFACGTAI